MKEDVDQSKKDNITLVDNNGRNITLLLDQYWDANQTKRVKIISRYSFIISDDIL
jgi:hypothetical protein